MHKHMIVTFFQFCKKENFFLIFNSQYDLLGLDTNVSRNLDRFPSVNTISKLREIQFLNFVKLYKIMQTGKIG